MMYTTEGKRMSSNNRLPCKWYAVSSMILLTAFSVTSLCLQGGIAEAWAQSQSSSPTTTLRLATIAPLDHPLDQATKKFAELLKNKTDSKVIVQVFNAASLGGEADIRDAVKAGAIDMGAITGSAFNSFLPEFDILSGYWIFDTNEEMVRVLEGPAGKELFEKLRAKAGIRVLAANWVQAAKHVVSRKPVRSLDDLKGLKMRVAAGYPLPQDLWTALGANPTPIAYPELYGALQTGVADALEVPIDWAYTAGFYQVCKYITKTAHWRWENLPFINEAKFGKLDAQTQKAIYEAADEAGKFYWNLSETTEVQYEKKIQEVGVTILQLNDVESFKARVTPVYLKGKGTWGWLYDQILNQKKIQ
jgi:TRAP-type transport system periplasmic protein